MSGKELNPVLMDIYKQGVSAHDRDIRNVIRYVRRPTTLTIRLKF